jgi:hypothetical protein
MRVKILVEWIGASKIRRQHRPEAAVKEAAVKNEFWYLENIIGCLQLR